MTILVLIVVFMITWEMFHGRISLNWVLLLLLVNFVNGARLKLMYISLTVKYQVKPYSSPWLSAPCATAIVYRNHFFCLYQHNKSFESKLSSDRLVIVAERFLKLPHLHMLIKQGSITSQNLGCQEFGWIVNSHISSYEACNCMCTPPHMPKFT